MSLIESKTVNGIESDLWSLRRGAGNQTWLLIIPGHGVRCVNFGGRGMARRMWVTVVGEDNETANNQVIHAHIRAHFGNANEYVRWEFELKGRGPWWESQIGLWYHVANQTDFHVVLKTSVFNSSDLSDLLFFVKQMNACNLIEIINLHDFVITPLLDQKAKRKDDPKFHYAIIYVNMRVGIRPLMKAITVYLRVWSRERHRVHSLCLREAIQDNNQHISCNIECTIVMP